MENAKRPEEQLIPPALKKWLPWIIAAFFGLMLIIWASRGFYNIQPGEEAAIRTFGAAQTETVKEEGLHWHWPSPIGRTDVRQTGKNRTTEVGFFTLPEGETSPLTGEQWQRDLDAATMITGDLNLVEVQAVAQYRISDLNCYLFCADDPGIRIEYFDFDSEIRTEETHKAGFPDGRTIQDAIEIALRKSMGLRNIDQALVSHREEVERETMEEAQRILDQWRTGLTITAVQLQEIKPPDPVQEAFDDVLRAREERETRINSALAYESRILPEARGEAERVRQDARAYAAQQVNQAQGEADRFQALLKEYQAAPQIIRERMYLETIEALNITFVLADEGQTVILNGTGQAITPLPANGGN